MYVLLYCIVYKCICIDCVYVLLYCIVYNMYMYILYVCLCMLQCGRTALPNTAGVENYKSNQINQRFRIRVRIPISIQ